MKASLTRKINLQKYGGNQYESADFFLEVESDNITSKDLQGLEYQMDDWIAEYIRKIPNQQKAFETATKEQPPF